MDRLKGFFRRLRAFRAGDSIGREIEEEYQFHLDMRAEENVRCGMAPGEARREAERRFGRLAHFKELGYEVRGGGWVAALWQDLRFGLRMLRKQKAFGVVAVSTLALGIGANVAIFSVLDAVVLRPLPFAEPGRLVSVWESSAGSANSRLIVSPANYLDWKERNRVFEEVGAYTEDFLNVSDDAAYPERLPAASASASLFQALGVRPALGRTFRPEEGAGDERVVILGHGLWRRRFGGDPQAVGKALKVNGLDHTVVGVLPADFIMSPRRYELYTPLRLNDRQRVNRRGRYLTVVARLRPGVTLEQARAEMQAVGRRLAEEYPDENGGRGATVSALGEDVTGGARTTLLVLFGAVSFILLITCANVASLLLGRAAARQREMSIRAALGAGRLRLVRQLLTESMALSLIGCLLGVLLARWGVDLLLSLSPSTLPRAEQVGIDLRVLGFAVLLSVVTALAFGLAPALHASGVDLSGGLKEGAKASAGARRNRFRSALVVAEVALSLVLLVGAGLLIKSFVRLSEVDLGFRAENVIAADISLPYRYNTGALRKEFFRGLIERVGALPGVKAASVSQSVPLSGEEHGAAFTIVGRPLPESRGKFGGIFHRVSADYLRVMGVPLLKGRALTEADTSEAPAVALVSEELARRHFPGEDPLGKQILLEGSPRAREIVGVVGNVRYLAPHVEPVSEIYISYLDAPYHHMSLAVRADGDPRRLVADIKAALTALDKDIPLANLKTMEEYVSGSKGGQRFGMTLIAAFAAAALLLAAVGVYGVMSGAVAQRTHEIGVRLALGAQPRDILKLIVGKGTVLTLAGVAAGLAGALALTRLMSSLLYEVSPTDPATYAGVSLLIAAVALLACYLPARRAVRIDPTEALRAE